MDRKHNSDLTQKGKLLRKNMTKEERYLWYDFLKDYPVRFLRQKVIDNFIVDFYCHQAKLAIELDGSQHYTDKGQLHDSNRTKVLEHYGISVLLFSNKDIDDNFEGVCFVIDRAIKENMPK